MRYLLDTCVISELVSKQPNPAVIGWIDQLEDERVYLSVITLGEIQKGVAKLPDSQRKELLERWLEEELLSRFQERILEIDLAVMRRWGKLCAQLDQVGRPMPAIDSLIAALALEHEMQLVTRNEADFQASGVALFNPWVAENI
ncbi:MAG: type II toxin-antitoxin system VapC family toxin [Anaerolineales bacterium]|nr:type II toxin-antitoxin system VapC family toxin [Anaerolineales bacterium]